MKYRIRIDAIESIERTENGYLREETKTIYQQDIEDLNVLEVIKAANSLEAEAKNIK